MNLKEAAIEKIPIMTKMEKKVAEYFLQNTGDFAFSTLDKMAQNINVSTTSILRFCRRMNFEGYKELQEELREEMKYQSNLSERFQQNVLSQTPNNENIINALNNGLQNLNKTFNELDPNILHTAVEKIANADNVYICGLREAFAMSHYLYTRLIAIRKNVSLLSVCIDGLIEPFMNIQENDVIVWFLFHRYTTQSVNLLSYLKKTSGYIILITSPPTEQVIEYSDLCIPCHVNGQVKNTYIAPVCLADYLCMALATINSDKTLQHLQATDTLFRDTNTVGY